MNLSRHLPLLCALALAGCGEFPEQPGGGPRTVSGDHGPEHPVDVSQVPDAVPVDVTPSRYGNPSSYTVLGKTYTLEPSCKGYHDRGIASWYGLQFHGGRTSDGETYDMYSMSAANKVVPIPCYARVTNLKNGKSVIVKINDRGPFVDNRLIDLSYAAASKLDMLGSGTALVDVQAVGPDDVAATTPLAAPAVGSITVTPLAPPVTAPAVAVTAPAAGGVQPQIFLQVGAFAERANADAVLLRLSGAGIARAFILPATESGRTLYKVRIGPLPDVDQVDALTRRMASFGYPEPQVVIP